MKRILTAVLFLLTYTAINAQSFLSVSSFKSAPGDVSASALQTRRQSINGAPCALVKISTRLEGLSFDAGMECIEDVVYVENGVWLYLPAGTRTITIAHANLGTLRNWHFPVTLESGRTYEMTLKSETLKPVQAPRQKEPTAVSFDRFSAHFIQSHIGVSLWEGSAEAMTLGLSYSFVPKRIGFHTSIEWALGTDGVAVFAGPAIRLTDSGSPTDCQLYLAPGITPCCKVGADLGMRFAWKTDKVLSLFDFSIGCQYWGEDIIVPYVGLGAGITGYTLAGILGLILCGICL